MSLTILGHETERTTTRGGRLTLPDFAPEVRGPTAGVYWRTLRRLGWRQVVALGRQRLRQRVSGRSRRAREAVRWRDFSQVSPFPQWQPAQARGMIETGEFTLLNHTQGSAEGIPWSSTALPRLWVYHLNYCDFLNLDLSRPEDRPILRKALRIMTAWCDQNAAGTEVGWEPYPLSLRIVNWLKFLSRNAAHLRAPEEKAAVAEILSSLQDQVLALEGKLEFHLMANHLLKNIKALMFAGELLDTCASSRWWTQGAKLLEAQLQEQILPDGGHFERSLMYHAEVLEDLLDLETLIASSSRLASCAAALSECVHRMAIFLEAMLHPDDEIPLLNDSAFGIAPPALELLVRAGKPEEASGSAGRPVKVLRETGYAAIREPVSKSCLIFDCGDVGPDAQPGHAHCDVLSYELSLDAQRVVVDTGTSTYEPGPERHYERSTAAHNTLRIDAEEQAEIWASFRVGRRPKVSRIEDGHVEDYHFVRGAHYGYEHLGIAHQRQIILGPGNRWIIVDVVRGTGTHRVESFIHFHPKACVEALPDADAASPDGFQKRFVIRVGSRSYVLLSSSEGRFELKEAWYSPEFGRREKQVVAYWTWEGVLPARLAYAFAPAEVDFPKIAFEYNPESLKIDNVRIPLG